LRWRRRLLCKRDCGKKDGKKKDFAHESRILNQRHREIADEKLRGLALGSEKALATSKAPFVLGTEIGFATYLISD
jgi:hypothetical protein